MTDLTFVGDVASTTPPRRGALPTFAGFVVGNLEGPVVDGTPPPFEARAVFQTSALIEAVPSLGIDAFTLANNHIMDFGAEGLTSTVNALRAAGVGHFGAGRNTQEARRPYLVEMDDSIVSLLGVGWPFIGCVPATAGRPGCAAMHHRRDTRQVQRAVELGHLPIVLPHWGYELSAYPLPGHVAYARSLVDAGAAAVIGAHAHVVQGHEVYQGSHIFYGLGNWLFMEGTYHGGRISFPPSAHLQLAVSMDVKRGAIVSRIFSKFPDGTLESHEEADPSSSAVLGELSPFRQMTTSQYADWYRRNAARRMLPVVTQMPGREPNWVGPWIRCRTMAAQLYRLVFPRSPTD